MAYYMNKNVPAKRGDIFYISNFYLELASFCICILRYFIKLKRKFKPSKSFPSYIFIVIYNS